MAANDSVSAQSSLPTLRSVKVSVLGWDKLQQCLNTPRASKFRLPRLGRALSLHQYARQLLQAGHSSAPASSNASLAARQLATGVPAGKGHHSQHAAHSGLIHRAWQLATQSSTAGRSSASQYTNLLRTRKPPSGNLQYARHMGRLYQTAATSGGASHATYLQNVNRYLQMSLALPAPRSLAWPILPFRPWDVASRLHSWLAHSSGYVQIALLSAFNLVGNHLPRLVGASAAAKAWLPCYLCCNRTFGACFASCGCSRSSVAH